MAAVEEFDLEEGRVDPAAGPPRRPGRRRVTPWIAAGAALIAAGALATPPGGLSVGFPESQVAMLAVDLSEPPTEEWRVDVRAWARQFQELAMLDGTLVVLTDGVRGIDPDSGEQLWLVDTPTSSCLVHEAVTCVVAAATPDAQVRRIERDGTTIEVVVPGAVRAVDAGGPDLVVALAGDGGNALRRITPSGEVVWEVLIRDLGLGQNVALESMTLTVLGDSVYVGAESPLVLDLADGSVRDSPSGWAHRTAFGYVTQTFDEGGYPNTALVDADGQVVVERVVVIPDDDPSSTIEVDNDLGATVTREGEVLWQQSSSYATARVDGVLVLSHWEADASYLSGHDLLTGEQLWEIEWRSTIQAAGGGTLLLWDPAGGLRGIDVHTGAELWTLPLSGSRQLLRPDGLILFDGNDVVRLSW